MLGLTVVYRIILKVHTINPLILDNNVMQHRGPTDCTVVEVDCLRLSRVPFIPYRYSTGPPVPQSTISV